MTPEPPGSAISALPEEFGRVFLLIGYQDPPPKIEGFEGLLRTRITLAGGTRRKSDLRGVDMKPPSR